MNSDDHPTGGFGKNTVPAGVAGGFFIYRVSPDEGLCYADPNVIGMFGCEDIDELREHVHDRFLGMVHPDDREAVENTIQEYNADTRKPRHYIRYRIVTKQGTFRYVEDFGRRLYGSDGKVYCYVFIAGIEAAEFEMPRQVIFEDAMFTEADSKIDRLTDLQNIDAFLLKAKDPKTGDGADGATDAAIVVFDILGLRKVNETFGHAEGNGRIRDLAEAVREYMPSSSVLYRGNEADIIAVCEGQNEQSLMDHIADVVRVCKSPVLFGVGCADASVPSQKSPLLQGLEDARLDLQIKKMLSVNSNRSQSLTSLICALEEVDADTEAHVRRTQKTGIALGRRIGLSDLQLSLLQLLCLLHDIGKIAVPLEILNKPGKLTDDEWAVLRMHPEKGRQIAVATDELKPLAEMILSHHERWDGRGYPSGLKGEEIPVLSRIISIVDAYDAMVNDRAYRNAMSSEEAQKEIRDNAGTQLDPYLANEFLALLEEDPSLSYGAKTGSAKVRVFDRSITESSGTGQTKPVAFSKYKLNMDDIIIEADDSFSAITGYTREDAVGKMSQFDLIPEEEREFYIQQVRRQFTAGDIAYLQHPLKRRDGTVIQVICNGERYFDSSVRAFRSTILIFEVS